MFDLISEIDCKGIDFIWIYQMLTAFFDVVCLILLFQWFILPSLTCSMETSLTAD